MLYSFFRSLARSGYLLLFLFSFSSSQWSAGTAKFNFRKVLFFSFFFFFSFLAITRPGRLVENRWLVCYPKSERTLCVSFSRTDSGFSIYRWLVWSKLNFSQSILSPSSRVVSYTLFVLIYSLIIRSIVSSLSLQNLHMLFCCMLSILALHYNFFYSFRVFHISVS